MTISQFTNELLDKVLNELKKKQNMNKIENNLVEPLIRYTFKRLYPYILISSSLHNSPQYNATTPTHSVPISLYPLLYCKNKYC